MEPVSYQIDSHDDVRSVSDSWTVFAVSNGAPHVDAHVDLGDEKTQEHARAHDADAVVLLQIEQV